MIPLTYVVFFQDNLSLHRISLVKHVLDQHAVQAIYHLCSEGFVSAWHQLTNQNNETHLTFFVSEEHIEAADVSFAVFCAQVPTLSFACSESCSSLLFSHSASSLISDEELILQFFSSSSNGSFVVVDGPDGAGKETQTELLKERLRKNFSVKHFSFPNYGGFCGNILRDVLCQKKGPLEKVAAPSLGLMFTLNRLSKRAELRWAQRQGYVVLLDRYFTANFGYQGYKVPDDDRECFIEYLERIEVNWLGLPLPDLVIYLDLPPLDALLAMKADKSRSELDANETASVDTKEKIREIFCWCCQRFLYWSLISSCDASGNRYSISQVHNMICEKLVSKLSFSPS